MPQLHLYVSDAVADPLRARAQTEELPLSRYLAKVVTASVTAGWPPGYFETVFGSSPDFEVPDWPDYSPLEPWDGTPDA